MSGNAEDLTRAIRGIVTQHYAQGSSPLLLSELGGRLRKQNLWPVEGAVGRSLREFIEASGDPDLSILRDKNSPAYIAVATAATRAVVQQWIERRSHAVGTVPDLEALPRPVLLAFCVQSEPGQPVYIRKTPPFRYESGPLPESDHDQFIAVEERYRRPGLKVADLNDLSASDRLDLQTRIAAWSKDKNVAIEMFYRQQTKKYASALERLLAAQPGGVAEKIVIPGDIALLLSRHE